MVLIEAGKRYVKGEITTLIALEHAIQAFLKAWLTLDHPYKSIHNPIFHIFTLLTFLTFKHIIVPSVHLQQLVVNFKIS